VLSTSWSAGDAMTRGRGKEKRKLAMTSSSFFCHVEQCGVRGLSVSRLSFAFATLVTILWTAFVANAILYDYYSTVCCRRIDLGVLQSSAGRCGSGVVWF
jgi:hypothetical protein